MKSLSSHSFWDIVEQHAAGRIDTLVAAEILANSRGVEFPQTRVSDLTRVNLNPLKELITDVLRIGLEQQNDTDMRLVVGGLWYTGPSTLHLQITPIVGYLVTGINEENAIVNLSLDPGTWPAIHGMASFWVEGREVPFQAPVENTTLEPSRFYSDCVRALDEAEAKADEVDDEDMD